MLRDFKLSLELHESAIFYHWNYSPPLKNIGGSFGRIFSDGALFGRTFDELKTLGSGTHDIRMDEHKRTPAGTRPRYNDERKQFELFKLTAFGYRHGAFTDTDLLQSALMAFNPLYSESLLKIAPEDLMQSLVEYAKRVPEILADRTPDSFEFFSNAGTNRIPTLNLQLLKRTLAPENAG